MGPSKVDVGSGDQTQAATGVAKSTSTNLDSASALPPIQTLDGYGQLGAPPARAAPISPDQIETAQPSPEHPPGYYGSSGATRAFNVITAKTVLTPLKPIEGAAQVSGYVMRKPVALESWLYLAVLALFALDVLAVVLMSMGFGFRRRGAVAASVLLCLALLPLPQPAKAETQQPATTNADDFAMKASLKTHLAYVMTGDAQIDEVSRQGLAGLSKVLTARTALEPAEPMGVDIDKDELAFFPILYWPVREDAEPLSDATLAKIDAFMKQGGFIIFDTRDQERSLPGSATQSKALTRLIGQLDVPPLEPVPEDHVLTKSFYLMRDFPGRWDGGTLWVEAEPENEADRSERSRRTDGVSSIVVTSNDLASAWALDDSNRPLYATVPGGEIQREMAFRAGVNLVMYALTGNYKADQVHLPALLERLGQ
jgi:hypothetical protein